MIFRKAFLIAIAAVSAVSVCAQQPDSDTPAADPARPTVTSPAHIPPPGYLQFEQGALIVAGAANFDTQTTILQCAKISLSHHIMVQEQWQPEANTRISGVSQNSGGAVTLGAQVLFTDEKEGHGSRPTLALGFLDTVHSGPAPDYDGGSAVRSLALLGSGEVKSFHYDANFIVNQVNNGSVRRAQLGQAIAITRNITPKLSVTGEIWHFAQPFTSTHAVGNIYAAAYTLKPTLVLDAGFNRGLTSTSAHWYGFFGFTYLLPHALWHRSGYTQPR